jgi:glycosyltransferase involved in cell wall biosynthesis
MPDARTVIVVPCFNEAARLRPAGFRPLLEDPETEVLFVDDGSTDDTAAVLADVAARWPSAQALRLERNGGKGEAVRRGMRAGLARGAELVGYLDADLATPAAEILRLRAALVETGADAVLAARVALLGRDIRRHASRHYLGRIFATTASAILQIPVYDTQCGAKLFRRTAALERALATPFHSRWIFDVELIGRIMPRAGEGAGIIEVPVQTWHDVKGSKLGPAQMARSASELLRIGVELARWRRRDH